MADPLSHPTQRSKQIRSGRQSSSTLSSSRVIPVTPTACRLQHCCSTALGMYQASALKMKYHPTACSTFPKRKAAVAAQRNWTVTPSPLTVDAIAVSPSTCDGDNDRNKRQCAPHHDANAGWGGSNDNVLMSIEDVADDSDSDDKFTNEDMFHLSQDSVASSIKTLKPSRRKSSARPKSLKILHLISTGGDATNVIYYQPTGGSSTDTAISHKRTNATTSFIRRRGSYMNQYHNNIV